MPSSQQLANAIRILSMDAVQQANSGHPGAPMGMADIAEVLWNHFLKHNPRNPQWLNRDRFILSNGHASMLLYALLHLSGYDVSINDLKQFRQLHSKTPGHPEFGYTPGVETTTGPLGQGLANAVGMAIAERTLAAQFNQPDFTLIDHFTYVFAGDGCLMEGISHEVCSLAGTQGLGKLIVFWDNNGISIDGDVKGWFTDDTPARFKAYGWQVLEIDGHQAHEIFTAIEAAQAHTQQPSLICCRTQIGKGSPNLAGSYETHGAPLGHAEIAAARAHLAWPHSAFEIPSDIYAAWDAKTRGQQWQQQWQQLFADYQQAYPELAKELMRRLTHQLPQNWDEIATAWINDCQTQAASIATRKASQNSICHYAKVLPELLGGSADLASSNLTLWPEASGISANNPQGNYLFYGVREFGMSAIMNGLALYGGFIPFGGTFLCFSDYARNAVRMAALMKQRVIFIYTHDSLGLGEDGPTHQPIEHAAMLRLTPQLSVWRPCDEAETAVAWRAAIIHAGPSCLLLSRQNLTPQIRTAQQVADMARGAYSLIDHPDPELILIATGSEVQLAVQAAQQLTSQGYCIRVVAMPSTDVFDAQPSAYQQAILPPEVTKRIAIEAGAKDYWYKYVGLSGKIIGMDRYGESAPAGELFKLFGFTVEHIIEVAQTLLA